MRVHWTRLLTAATTYALVGVCLLAPPNAVLAQDKQPQWKDRAEYDLYDSIAKEQNPQTRLSLLDQWKQKYPESDYELNRLRFYLITYQALNQAPKMLETCKAILAKVPDDMQGLYWATLLTISMNDTSAEALEFGQKSAQALLKNLDSVFAPDKRPAATPEAQWKKERDNLEAIAHNTLGWVEMQRKNYEAAEAEFLKVLALNPENAQASYWLGTVILAQRNPDKQSTGLYHLARASQYSGSGALPDATKKQILSYLEGVYSKYHGSREGLDEILKQAQTNPLPPQGFHIQSAVEVEVARKEALRKSNPMQYLWQEVIKAPLMADDGMEYFNAKLKDAVLPGNVEGISKLRGRVVSQNPSTRPTEVYLAITEGSNVPEVLLKLDGPMRLPAPPGTVIGFEGPVRSFTKSPRFLLVFEVSRDQIVGWPKAAGPAN